MPPQRWCRPYILVGRLLVHILQLVNLHIILLVSVSLLAIIAIAIVVVSSSLKSLTIPLALFLLHLLPGCRPSHSRKYSQSSYTAIFDTTIQGPTSVFLMHTYLLYR